MSLMNHDTSLGFGGPAPAPVPSPQPLAPRAAEVPQPTGPIPSPRQASPPGATRPAVGRVVRLHRVSDVRRQQGVSVRSASRRMGVPMEQVRSEERGTTDLTLTQLARWQKALEVPLVDLLVEQHAPLSTPVLCRAQWLRLMKTIRALAESSPNAQVERLAAMLQEQVLAIMPELRDVSAWHSVGQRRTHDEVGRIAERPVPSSFARDGLH